MSLSFVEHIFLCGTIIYSRLVQFFPPCLSSEKGTLFLLLDLSLTLCNFLFLFWLSLGRSYIIWLVTVVQSETILSAYGLSLTTQDFIWESCAFCGLLPSGTYNHCLTKLQKYSRMHFKSFMLGLLVCCLVAGSPASLWLSPTPGIVNILGENWPGVWSP